MTMLLLGGIGAIGFAVGTQVRKRNWPTLQEQIDAVLKSASPANAEDLLRLIGARCVTGAGGGKWSLHLVVGSATIQTPERAHLALVIQDIAAFDAMVLAAKTVSGV